MLKKTFKLLAIKLQERSQLAKEPALAPIRRHACPLQKKRAMQRRLLAKPLTVPVDRPKTQQAI
jgi:hypothetical protein